MIKSLRISKKYIALILIFVLILSSVPMQVFAKDKSKVVQPNNYHDEGMEEGKVKKAKDKYKLPKANTERKELKTRKDKYKKEYINPDGTFTIEVSKNPIHYKDKNGKWQEIDNTLVDSKKQGYVYENKANDFKVNFAENNQNKHLVHYSLEEDIWVSFSPEDKFMGAGKIKKSSIEYNDIIEDVDLRYILVGNKLKEEIVLNKKLSKNTFTFDIDYEGIYLEKDEDGIVNGYSEKTNEKLINFNKLYAIDAKEAITYDVTIDLINEGNNEKLVVTVDNEWLENASYPVIIDPTIETVTIQPDEYESKDVYVSERYPSTSYYLSDYLHAGNHTVYDRTRSFIRFDYLPSLPPGAKINSANFETFMYLPSTTSTNITVHNVIQPWTSSSTTWNIKPDYEAAVLDSKANGPANSWWTFDITTAVRQWYYGIYDNNGIMLKAENESSPTRSFFSGDATGNPTPKLVINYEVDPRGSESHFGFDGNVNVHNGNLVTSSTDVILQGRGIPINITRTFNLNSQDSSILGKGWNLNVEMHLDYAPDKKVVRLTDGDGTWKYFVKDSTGGYQPPVGVYQILTLEGNSFVLEELSGIKYYFTQEGKLDKIVDNHDNTTGITYDGNNRIQSVIDPTGRTVTFNYTVDGKLDSITGNEIPTVDYDYNGEYLTYSRLIDPNDPSKNYGETTFVYDEISNEFTLEDSRGNKTIVTYDSNKRVTNINMKLTKEVNEVDTIVDLDTIYSYSEADPNYGMITTVTYPKGNITEYYTNKAGNVEKVIQDKGGEEITSTYEWDEFQNLISIKDPKSQSVGDKATFEFEYGNNGIMKSIKNKSGHTTIFQTNENNQVDKITDPMGRSTERDYDNLNRNLLAVSNPLSSSTVIDYDNGDSNGVGNITKTTNPITMGNNHIMNSGFEWWENETPTNWEQFGSLGTISDDTTEKSNGSYSAKLNISGGTSGDEVVLRTDYIEVIPSTKYNLSWFVKTLNVDSYGGGATVEVQYYDSGYVWLGDGEASLNLAPSSGTQDWERKSARINVPANAQYAKIKLIVNKNGTAWFDNVQLEQGSLINESNYLTNFSFEKDEDSDGYPDDWDLTNISSSDGSDSTNIITGSSSFLINGESTYKYFFQDKVVEGEEGTLLHFSGWSKSEGVTQTGGDYQLILQIHYKEDIDGNGNLDDDSDKYRIDFTKSDNGWEYKEGNVVTKHDFDKITIYGKLQNHPGGKAWYDDFRARLDAPANALISKYNIAQNGSFENDWNSTNWPDYWPAYYNVAPGEISWTGIDSNTFPINGDKMIKMVDVPDWATVANTQYEPIKPLQEIEDSGENKYYTASTVIKTDNISGDGAVLKFDILDSNNQYITQKLSKKINTDKDWTRVTVTISEKEAHELAAGSGKIPAKIKVAVGVVAPTNGTMYFDAVRMNEGNIETHYKYDGLNKNYVTEIVDLLGNSMKFVNDNRGNVTKITDPKNNVYDYKYDAIDRIEYIDYPSNLRTEYIDSDGDGTIDTVENRDKDTTDINGEYTKINTSVKVMLNELGLIKSISDNEQSATNFEYDENVNLKRIDYPNGNKVHYNYDNLDRITNISYTGDSTTWDLGYDKNGNILNVKKNSVSATTYEYDELDRMSKITDDISGNTVDYGYNRAGNVIQIINSINTTSSKETILKYDEGGNVTDITGPNGISMAFMYDEEGNLNKSYKQGSGTFYITYKEHDDLGRIIENRVEKPDGTIITQYFYEYDKNGNKVAEKDLVNNKRIVYAYDAINQMVSETYYDDVVGGTATKNISYEYDKIGNRTKKIVNGGTLTEFAYNGDNEITHFNGSLQYEHDENGNLTKAFDWSYIYNGEDQLIEVKQNSFTVAKYEYNLKGLRTKKELVQEGKTEYYHYNGDKLVYITDENNNLKYYFQRDMIGKAVNMLDYTASQTNPTIYWYLYGSHGNVVGLADANGDIVASYEYDAWGNITSQSSTVNTGDGVALWKANPFRYSEYQYDDETGMYYLKSRYYSPFLGRFITRDAIFDVNLYKYGANNPATFVDPSGYFADDESGNIGGPITPGGGGALVPLLMHLIKNWDKVENVINFARISYTLYQIGDVISEATSKASSAVLRKNLTKAGIKEPGFANAAHHIIAGTDKRAAGVRTILQKYGIDINDAVNGVFLPTKKGVSEAAYHRSLHTNLYYKNVEEMLQGVSSKEEVIEVLDDIRQQLLDGTFSH